VPLRAVDVVRYPFDNIASMKLWRAAPLEQVVEEYFGLCDAMAVLRQRLAPDELAEVRYEDLVADPRLVLQSLAGSLGVDAEPAWVTAAAMVDATPSRSRAKLAWPPELVAGIERRLGRYEFLTGYGFDT
jgi:Sulfotransferase family